ncbi:MAG: VCBS repeat-containing protein [Bacteroidales bacterium]|nr:VCBS repeat-containing protein [Bacteroidales bacterium]
MANITGISQKTWSNEITLSWTNPLKKVDGVIIERAIGNGASTQVAKLLYGTETWTDKNIQEGGVQYTYKIYAVAGQNKSEISEKQITPILPPKVFVKIENIKSDSATVSVQLQNEGGQVNYYEIMLSKTPDFKALAIDYSESANPDSVISKRFRLEALTTYYTKVRIQSYYNTSLEDTTVEGASFTTPSYIGSFAPKVDYPTGSNPQSIAVGDFNSDSIPDLAVVNSNSNTVSILLGRGDGTFSPKVDYATGLQPQCVTTGDFNGDGILDLAVVNSNSNTVSILLGNGDGTFNPKVDYTSGLNVNNPIGITTADFNGDGRNDLVVIGSSNYNTNTYSISLLIGTGNGGFFWQTTIYPNGKQPSYVTTADFNLDGIPDLAWTNSNSNTVSTVLNNGDANNFWASYGVEYTTGSTPTSVTTGDFNQDGIPDLAVTNSGSNTVSILLGKGDGTFNSKVDYPTGIQPQCVTVGDFNGDGIPDLAVANASSSTVSILMGKGDGTFAPKVDYTTGNTPYFVATGDFNGDGKTDLVVANFGAATVSVLINY